MAWASRTCQLMAKGIHTTRPVRGILSPIYYYSTATLSSSASPFTPPLPLSSTPPSATPTTSSTIPPSSTSATTTQESTEWWSPEDKANKLLPELNIEGEEKEKRRVVNVGGIRPDGRSPRWYNEVKVEKVDGGYSFLLDGRVARTQYEPLIVPSEQLALVMAFEWMAQDKFILPDALPVTRLATMAIDQMPNARARVINHLMLAFDTDLTCVRIEEDLLAEQKKAYTPMLDWFAEKFENKPKTSILYGKLKHPPELVRKVREYITNLDDFHLQALELLSAATRSVVLPLYLVHGQTSIENAIKAARLEEEAQIKANGNVQSTHDVDRTEVSTRIAVGSLFWRLLELK